MKKMMMKKKWCGLGFSYIKGKSFACFLLAASIFVSSFTIVEETFAQGLQVLPTRIVFEGRKRSAQVTLINQGDEETTYRIGFKNMRMNQDGSYLEIEKPGPGEHFSEGLIRYSPRQVKIKPGTSQTIRLLLRKKKGTAGGEYRSHMMFQSVPKADASKSLEALASDKEGDIKIALIPIYGISIPVIVRHGKVKVKSGLSELSINDSQPHPETGVISKIIDFKINRDGNQSVYGDLSGIFINQSGDELEVARLNGVAVYVPNKSRDVRLRLNIPDGVELKNGLLKLSYRQPKDEGNKIMAEGQLRIP